MKTNFKTDPEVLDGIRSLVAEFESKRRNLIPILQRIQEKCAYIPPEAMQLVGEHLKIPASEVHGVATFYNQFRFHPPGRHPIKVCLGTACHVKGGEIILENFERKLQITTGETTADREYSLERVACVGCCVLAPVGIIDEIIHGHMVPSKIEGIMLGFQMAKENEQKKESEDEPESS